jgi:hypothetical protein
VVPVPVPVPKYRSGPQLSRSVQCFIEEIQNVQADGLKIIISGSGMMKGHVTYILIRNGQHGNGWTMELCYLLRVEQVYEHMVNKMTYSLDTEDFRKF